MRLLELRHRGAPKQAGKAILEYSDKLEHPKREGKVITLPDRNNLELFRLQKNWNQFLIHDHKGDTVWFGGTDENPFLVQMNSSVSQDFLETPLAFYKRLVPEIINKLVRMFPTAQYRRQGDIFAFPLPFSWEEIIKSFEICHWSNLEPKKGKFPLFGTRHSVVGTAVMVKREFSLLGQVEVGTVVEGVVKAPDHSDMKLEGPHAVAQTAHLYSPPEAD